MRIQLYYEILNFNRYFCSIRLAFKQTLIISIMENIEKLIFTIIGVGIGIALKMYLDYRKEKKHRETVKDEMNDKVVTQKNILKLLPGKTVNNMKSMLGEPLIYNLYDFNVHEMATGFVEDNDNTHAYLYRFKNVDLKITSKNNVSIDSLTIMPRDNNKVELSDLFLDKMVINESRLGISMEQLVLKHSLITNMIHRFAYVQIYYGSPIFKNLTCFFIDNDTVEPYTMKKDVQQLLNKKIEGVCISSSMNNHAYYIYPNEFS
jgi:hypothetical protein